MFMPPSSHETMNSAARMSNLEYARRRAMGHIGWASEVFQLLRADTGNMEVLMRYGTKEHKRKWLRPLMDGEIRSAFLRRARVASSDATNIETSIKRDGDHYVIQRRKWWSSGRRRSGCQVLIVMGKTDPGARATNSNRKFWCRADAKGITVEKMLRCLALTMRRTAMPNVLENVRVPPAYFAGEAGVLRSRRAVSVPAASTTACAPSARRGGAGEDG